MPLGPATSQGAQHEPGPLTERGADSVMMPHESLMAPSLLSRVLAWLPAPRRRMSDRITKRILMGQVLSDPSASAKLLGVLSIVYLAVALLFFLFGPWAIFILVLALHRAIYEVARGIVWPGQLRSFSRRIEKLAASDVHAHFIACSSAIEETADSLVSACQDPTERINHIAHQSQLLIEPLVESMAAVSSASAIAEQNELVDAAREFKAARTELSELVSAGAHLLVPAAQRLVTASRRLRDSAGALIEPVKPSAPTDEDPKSLPTRVWRLLKSQVWAVIEARRRFQGLASFDLYRAHLIQARSGQRETVVAKDGTRIDALLLPGQQQPRRLLVVLCNPNAALFELLALHPFWIDYYRPLADVVVWNYRGYGESGGSVTPRAVREDIEAVMEHFSSSAAQEGVGPCKLMVHGESIGGIASCHAATLPGVDMVVADRTFSSLEAISHQLVGPYVSRVFQGLTRWNADNVRGILKMGTKGVILQDVHDKVIPHRASLKTGVARALCPIQGELELAHAFGVLVASCKEETRVRLPSPTSATELVDFDPPVLATAQRAALMPFVVRLMQISACGQTLGESVAAEITGRRGTIGDWLACARVWAPRLLPRWELEANIPEPTRAAADLVLRALAQQPELSGPAPRLVDITCGHSGQPAASELVALNRSLAQLLAGGDAV